VGEITVSVVGSKNPNWFDTHQIPKNAAYAIPDEAATRLRTASLDVTDPTAATRVVSDDLGGSRGTAYAASKFAVAGFTESLALELEEFGITATIVGPGYFRTDFLDKSSAILEPATLIEDYRASNAAFRAATETANHAQQGDPNALGRLLVEIAAERKPPLHLPVGRRRRPACRAASQLRAERYQGLARQEQQHGFQRRLVFVRRLYHVQDRWRTPGPATTV
jgi:NAD(P)-dependent dehydrogenase (short-subunit alcohol dehydrogenase family)